MNKYILFALAVLIAGTAGNAQTFSYGNFYDAKAGGASPNQPLDCTSLKGVYTAEVEHMHKITDLNVHFDSADSGEFHYRVGFIVGNIPVRSSPPDRIVCAPNSLILERVSTESTPTGLVTTLRTFILNYHPSTNTLDVTEQSVRDGQLIFQSSTTLIKTSQIPHPSPLFENMMRTKTALFYRR